MGILIQSPEDLAKLVEELGFLPLLKSYVPGFSVEEYTPPELWFADGVDGPWEWKGPVIQMTGCAYGKFFAGKAGFISREWFYDFANYRRDGYDFDARYDDGLARFSDKTVYDILAEHSPLVSKDWRRMSGIRKRGEFDAVVARLQMLCYVVTADFVYPRSKTGKPYGWGLAEYATPEALFGADFTGKVYARAPEESGLRVAAHLEKLLPQASPAQVQRLLGSRR